MNLATARDCFLASLGELETLRISMTHPSDVALASDPGYPVYTAGPLLAGAEAWKMPLVPSRGFTPDLASIPA
jgi:LL-diaminopimelate aminotransferase